MIRPLLLSCLLLTAHCYANDVALRAPKSFLQSQTLKHVKVSADPRLWEVVDDKADEDGDVEFTLGHKRSGSAILLQIQELYEDTKNVSLIRSLRTIINIHKKGAKAYKELRPYKELAIPADTICKYYEMIAEDEDDALQYASCAYLGKGWWAFLSVVLVPGEWKAYQSDLNQVLRSIRFN